MKSSKLFNWSTYHGSCHFDRWFGSPEKSHSHGDLFGFIKKKWKAWCGVSKFEFCISSAVNSSQMLQVSARWVLWSPRGTILRKKLPKLPSHVEKSNTVCLVNSGRFESSIDILMAVNSWNTKHTNLHSHLTACVSATSQVRFPASYLSYYFYCVCPWVLRALRPIAHADSAWVPNGPICSTKVAWKHRPPVAQRSPSLKMVHSTVLYVIDLIDKILLKVTRNQFLMCEMMCPDSSKRWIIL